MWALRRASSNPIRTQVVNLATFRASSAIGPLNNHTEPNESSLKQPMLDKRLTSEPSSFIIPIPFRFSSNNRGLSSKAGSNSSGAKEYDLEEGFFELETTKASTSIGECDDVDNITSTFDSEFFGDEENLEDAIESELKIDTEVNGKDKGMKVSDLCRLIIDVRGPSISDALDKYVADGKDISRSQIYDALLPLRRFKMYGKALQLLEWSEKNDRLEFVERDYASRVDLIAKVRDVHKAENYINKIPEPYQKELVYRTLLANCVITTNAKKAEKVFNKMKELGFPMTTFACNQLLLLYKRTDKRKIAEILRLMEKENVKPTIFTYQLLIDTKGLSNDIVGMEQIVETMKAAGIEPSIRIQATLARHYASAGLKDKAENILKELEGNDLEVNRWVCPILLPIYAELGKMDEVERVWKVCESKPRQRECLTGIEAWGKLKNVKKAEEIFEKMSSKSKKKGLEVAYTVMLKAYGENKMVEKGKELVKRMGDNGCHIGPITLDALVKLYVEGGEVEKADSVLNKLAKQSTKKPLFSSYMSVLDKYAERGDVHNCEKIFHRMRQVGYVSRARPFQSLLRGYVKAKIPAYGFMERMKADNIVPNKSFVAQLALVDAFKKTAVSDLLD